MEENSSYQLCRLNSSVKYPPSVITWGLWRRSSGVGPLYFIKTKLNTLVYHDILKDFIAFLSRRAFYDAEFNFQQDLAHLHRMLEQQDGVFNMILHCLIGQPKTPGLTTIANLCRTLKKTVKIICPNNIDELKAAIRDTWASITPQQCHRLILSMQWM